MGTVMRAGKDKHVILYDTQDAMNIDRGSSRSLRILKRKCIRRCPNSKTIMLFGIFCAS